MEPYESPEILTIEWEMMDKSRFLCFSMLNSFTLRCLVYPLTVIKTRLQVQTTMHPVYDGTFDAFRKIIKYEGARGLYRGFWINSIQIFSGIGYLATYENVRHALQRHGGITDNRIKGLIGGGIGSLVGQTVITPFDVISQHMMVLGQPINSRVKNAQNTTQIVNPLNIKLDKVRRHELFLAVMREVYRRDGFFGFYRGYFASLISYVPASGLWWMFYPLYTEALLNVVPEWTSFLAVQCFAGPLSGCTVCVMTNPMDVVRARIQVQRTRSVVSTFGALWGEERYRVFTIGLSARIMQSMISSFLLVLGYETLKRWSVREEFKNKIRW